MGNKQEKNVHPENIVILHQFPRGFRAPSPSPYALKLETWLRMAKINYQNVHGLKTSPKGKVPWITLNGQVFADSQFIIDHLANVYDKDLSKNLSDKEKAIERAFLKMIEESLSWCMTLQRFVYGPSTAESGISKAFLILGAHKIKSRAKAQGYGLHSKEEVYAIGRADLQAINDFIGEKPYFFGNQVTNVDACLFGFMCQFVFHERGPLNRFILDHCHNILRFVDNVKSTYWPDWNEVVRDKSMFEA